MKYIFSTLLLFVVAVSLSAQSTLEQFLAKQPEVKSVEKIEGNEFFSATYKIMVEQPLDHNDPSKGYFQQRIFVADKGKSNPVLLITEGYGADYAFRASYLNELSPMLNSNQICVEHRYFGDSWPHPNNWEYLTVSNAAADHHKITLLLKRYYSGSWINTGISKGGQTAVYHRWLYPDDVKVSVAYVCPLNFGLEDGRHEPFIRDIPGTPGIRQKILDYQLAVLKNRKQILPMLKDYSDDKNYSYRINLDEVLDYCVLEYPFALWQWGKYLDDIPSKEASVNTLFNHLMKVSSPSYFAIEGMEDIKSFFVQAAHELGYYGYDTRPYKKYLYIKSANDYLSKIFLPDSFNMKYEKETAKKVKRFIGRTDSKILFIYGAFDPWSASGFEVPKKSNLVKVVKPGGSHSTRIENLPNDQKNLVKNTLSGWLQVPVSIN